MTPFCWVISDFSKGLGTSAFRVKQSTLNNPRKMVASVLYPARSRWGTYHGCCSKKDGARTSVNPFQPKLILVHTTVTGTCHRAYKTCKNWPLCSYVGCHQHSQPNTEKSAQCAKMTTGANGQKACIIRTDEKHDAIWHHGAGKG